MVLLGILACVLPIVVADALAGDLFTDGLLGAHSFGTIPSEDKAKDVDSAVKNAAVFPFDLNPFDHNGLGFGHFCGNSTCHNNDAWCGKPGCKPECDDEKVLIRGCSKTTDYVLFYGNSKRTRALARKKCASIGGALADVNTKNIKCLSYAIKSKGDPAYINSWNTDTYLDAHIALYPNSAIAVPPGPDSHSFLCQVPHGKCKVDGYHSHDGNCGHHACNNSVTSFDDEVDGDQGESHNEVDSGFNFPFPFKDVIRQAGKIVAQKLTMQGQMSPKKVQKAESKDSDASDATNDKKKQAEAKKTPESTSSKKPQVQGKQQNAKPQAQVKEKEQVKEKAQTKEKDQTKEKAQAKEKVKEQIEKKQAKKEKAASKENLQQQLATEAKQAKAAN